MKAHPRGFTLMEIAATLSLLGTFSLLGVELLNTSMRVTHQSVAAEETVFRMDAAIASLRRDAWGAEALASTNKSSLRIDSSGGGEIDWSVESGDLVRKQNGRQNRWAGAGEGCSFQTSGPTVVLSCELHRQTMELRLVSQFEVAAGGSP